MQIGSTNATDGNQTNREREVQAPPEALDAYVEVARAYYLHEEERWRTAQDKAKTVFAVAALVATLIFSKLDWALRAAAEREGFDVHPG